MISKENGEFIVKGVTLGPKFTKDDFLKSPLFDEVLRAREYPNTYYYYIKPQIIGEDYFVLVLYFNGRGILIMITLGIAPNGIVPSWEKWSEEQEIEVELQHDEWLDKMLGRPPYSYDWGAIASSYDSRSASSSITIRYKENE